MSDDNDDDFGSNSSDGSTENDAEEEEMALSENSQTQNNLPKYRGDSRYVDSNEFNLCLQMQSCPGSASSQTTTTAKMDTTIPTLIEINTVLEHFVLYVNLPDKAPSTDSGKVPTAAQSRANRIRDIWSRLLVSAAHNRTLTEMLLRVNNPNFVKSFQKAQKLTNNSESSAPSAPTYHMTKYEYTRIRGFRLEQLARGALPLVSYGGQQNLEKIFDDEMLEDKLPIIVRRMQPNGKQLLIPVRQFSNRHEFITPHHCE